MLVKQIIPTATVGMARGIPRPSILEVPDLFSLLNSPRNRFYHSSTPRVLVKIFTFKRNSVFSRSSANFGEDSRSRGVIKSIPRGIEE